MKVFILVFLLAVVGCSSVGDRAPVSLNAAKAITLVETKSSQADAESLERALRDTLEFCAPILQGYENKSEVQANKAYWLAISGLVAGSVIVPALTTANAAANASYIAALSGWSGATNFASESLRTSGLSGSAVAETRNRIIANLQSSVAIATDATKSFDEKKAAILSARSSCVIYDIAIPTVPATSK